MVNGSLKAGESYLIEEDITATNCVGRFLYFCLDKNQHHIAVFDLTSESERDSVFWGNYIAAIPRLTGSSLYDIGNISFSCRFSKTSYTA